MKNPKKLKLKHKKFLADQGLDSKNFLIVATYPDSYRFFHINSGKIVDIRR